MAGPPARADRQIGRLLASARATNSLPEVEPGAVIFNRLWPLAIFTLASGARGVPDPPDPGDRGGLRDRRGADVAQAGRRGQAIEERDGAQFYFDKSSPFGAPKLVRTPGLRKVEPEAVAPPV